MSTDQADSTTVNPFTTESARRALFALRAFPAGLVSLGAAATGRHGWAGRWQLAAADPSESERIDRRSPSWLRVLAHSLLSLLIGMVAWFFAFLSVIAAFRGLFYGLITDGSYEYSWGGPTLAGAWLVHLVLGVLLVPVAMWILKAIASLLAGLTRRLLGEDGPVWAVPVALVLAAAGALLFRSWLHQA
ncbi:hypothetical protein [Rhodococcus sp. IEGM 1307]|uniref:hypothetical protein n=1 Tax=Rhodococcus sp. IEGM 1307 TaxID=3047091 RepID=UPI0024B800DB|nr:hypothetical protein [Rhodococcus sp. IEGM 1307]MDI9976556.1 hypothetical protein [Rhodococcus sp. IEGM 1307]